MGRGAEGIHIASIVKAFELLGHKVSVISPPGIDPLREVGQSPLDKSEAKVRGLSLLWKIISRHAPQVFFEVFEILYNFYGIRKMQELVKKGGFDLLYERNAYFLFAAAYISRKYGIPLAVEANEVVGIKRARKLRLRKPATWIEKYTLRSAQSIFVVSSFLREKVKEIVENKVDVCVTPNAVDPLLYERVTQRDEIRQRLGISQRIVIGFAGWFDWWDRLDLLLNAQKQIRKSGYANVTTLLIGDGSMTKELKERAKNLQIEDSVIFVGPVMRKDVIDYIDAFDIGILPHSNEFGSPVVLFEMMALGKPVVVPSLPPMNDVITHNLNGLIFEPLNEQDMVKKIITVIEQPNLCKKLGNNARNLTKRKHTWVGNAKMVLETLGKATLHSQ
jgi:glycosyltransferase involved in cell wall biosynthesis